MTRLLLRTLRRLTAVEEPLEIFAKLTFGSTRDLDVLDLDISVYLLDDESQVTKARTEHCASFSSPPQQQEASLTLHGFSSVELAETLGETDFEFTQRRHREMRFIDNEELLQVAAVVKAEFEQRQRFTTAEEMWKYINHRLSCDDEEWRSLCENKKKKRWKKWIAEPLHQEDLPGLDGS